HNKRLAFGASASRCANASNTSISPVMSRSCVPVRRQTSAIGLRVEENGPAMCSTTSTSPSAASSLEESESSKVRYCKPSVSATPFSFASLRPATLISGGAGGEFPPEPGRPIDEKFPRLLHRSEPRRCRIFHTHSLSRRAWSPGEQSLAFHTEPPTRSSWARFGSASVLFESMLPDGRLTYML